MGRSKRQAPNARHRQRGARHERRDVNGALERLRFAYFAQAGESAGRYGIEFDEIVIHLWRHRCARGRLALNTVRHIDDLVHAIACLNRVGPAWSDLVERHEPVLVRRCVDRFGEMQAILLVRRMFAIIRQDDGETTLHTYIGDKPLRTWLAERVTGHLHGQHTVWCEPADAAGGTSAIRRSLPILGLDSEDDGPSCLPFAVEAADVVCTES